MERPTVPFADLIDDDDRMFRVHGSIYSDAQVFAAEMRNIFTRTWVYVGHESEIPNTGDYTTTSIGQQPVIVSRHEDGQIYVMLNRCRHRGTVVCRDDRGHSNFFRCPYHNWVYRNDGGLVGVSMAAGYDAADLPKEELGLMPVPRVGTYRGLVFASMRDDSPSLEEHLGPVMSYIDLWANRSPQGSVTMLPTLHKYPYPANWKWQAENGADGYHGNYVHESWQKVLQRAGEAKVKDVRKFRAEGCTRGLGNGHGVLERPGGSNPASSWTGRMMDKFPEYAQALRRQFSEDEIESISARRNIFVFPNIYLFDTHVRVIHPVNPCYTEVRLYVYALDGVPDELNEGRYRAHERFYGPSGFGSPDDLEVFTANQTGMQATGVDWVLLNRGQHRETREGNERVGHSSDEVPTREIYREWKRLMAATD
jgi:benzoate/toluate 1,2-dioxygenase subunit alpha